MFFQNDFRLDNENFFLFVYYIDQKIRYINIVQSRLSEYLVIVSNN